VAVSKGKPNADVALPQGTVTFLFTAAHADARRCAGVASTSPKSPAFTGRSS
jgi:hypothetical protein